MITHSANSVFVNDYDGIFCEHELQTLPESIIMCMVLDHI